MPPTERIDAPGALHHVIRRGIARLNIFRHDTDRNRFVKKRRRVGRFEIHAENVDPFERR